MPTRDPPAAPAPETLACKLNCMHQRAALRPAVTHASLLPRCGPLLAAATRCDTLLQASAPRRSSPESDLT